MSNRVLFVGDSELNLENIFESFKLGCKKVSNVSEDGFEISIEDGECYDVSLEYLEDIDIDSLDVDLKIVFLCKSITAKDGIRNYIDLVTKLCNSVILLIGIGEMCKEPDFSESENELKPFTYHQGIQMASGLGAASFHMFTPSEDQKLDIENVWNDSFKLLKIRQKYINASKANLENQGLVTFPGFIGSENLTNLNLSNNQLIEISCRQLYLNHFFNIEKLVLRNNKLTKLTPIIGRLKLLNHLDISYNHIVTLTASIYDCENLTHLIMRNNQIDNLPVGLHHLKKLLVVDLRENPLGAILPEVLPKSKHLCGTDISKLQKYLSSLEEGKSEEFRRVKIMFVGDANVGKSSLLNYMETNKPSSEEYNVATDGIDLKALDLGGVFFDCWDFAGQELYYTTHQFFLTSKAIYLLVFNAANPNISNLNYWLRSIRMKTKNASIIIDAINEGDYSELLKNDQLNNERAAMNCFHHFNEGPITFSPTYRYDRGTREWSDEKMREPAYCDRILWKTPYFDNLTLHSYQAAHGLMTSDHSPVYALFSVKVDYPPLPHDRMPCHILIRNLKGFELNKENTKQELYLSFQSPWILSQYNTGVCKKPPPDPEWADVDIPNVSSVITLPDYLERQCLRVIVRDNKNSYLGSGMINLKGCIEKVVTFTCDLSLGGLPWGRLSGDIRIVSSNLPQTISFDTKLSSPTIGSTGRSELTKSKIHIPRSLTTRIPQQKTANVLTTSTPLRSLSTASIQYDSGTPRGSIWVSSTPRSPNNEKRSPSTSSHSNQNDEEESNS